MELLGRWAGAFWGEAAFWGGRASLGWKRRALDERLLAEPWVLCSSDDGQLLDCTARLR